MTQKTHIKKIRLAMMYTLLVLAGVFTSQLFMNKETVTAGYPGFGGDFTLQSNHGPVPLKDYRGKVVVLYFGYTSCADVCPTSLGMLSVALKKMSPQELDQVQAFFISVDPERDTLLRLQEYANAFHPKIMGITGTANEIAELASRYKVLYKKVELPESALGYAVDHSSIYYVIDRKGVLQKLIYHGTPVDRIVADLRDVLHK